jgi:hypothetical protein
MASGKLGSASLSAGVDTLLYTVPSGKVATANIRVANRNPETINVSVAIGTGGSLANYDYITFNTPVEAYSILEEIAVMMSPNEKVWVRSNLGSVSVRVHGVES